jgi:hypothetical protein
MERDAIDSAARDAARHLAMRVGNLERRLLDYRDVIAGLGLLVSVLAIAVIWRW